MDWIETWSGADEEGWQSNSGDMTAGYTSADGGYLQLGFGEQPGPPWPEDGTAYADSGASGGRFVGDYAGIMTESGQGLTAQFDFLAEDYLPGFVDLFFKSAVSGRTWMFALPNPPAVDTWTQYVVNFDFAAGWSYGPGATEEQFLADLADVEWIGVHVERSLELGEQFYGIDNFVLYVPEPGTWCMLAGVALALLVHIRLRRRAAAPACGVAR
ncbi:MAG: hypothetical protein JXR37_00215 [Kiritimatiellae bacterium]|nr:hypothetical protein [Kiritimatiellia bacterium]